MLSEPECYKRWCKHYKGVKQPDGTEETERHVCGAFPEGIPEDIVYGINKHLKVFPGQRGKILYERGT